ncbi:hypothetical protein COT72_02625 [archaeon CG10_big_fil_rev_8_21_14_0_10_43_11]|nr:MAG: hypothetical protein COT72_02625 [archaeon CG10_big_fil_rev_8_21_14_0_10_43_11]
MGSRNGQINIDLLFGYVVFIIFVAYFSGFVLDLFNPFIDYSRVIATEKNNILFRNEVITNLNLKTIGAACNKTVPNLAGSNISYQINALNILGKDDFAVFPNETSGRVVIAREKGDILVMAGTNFTAINTTLIFSIPEAVVGIDELNTSAGDGISYVFDSSNNLVFYVNLSVTQSDPFSAYRILTTITQPTFIIIIGLFDRQTGQNQYNLLYIGDVKAQDSCEAGAQTDLKTTFSHYENLGNTIEDYLSYLEASAWWELE